MAFWEMNGWWWAQSNRREEGGVVTVHGSVDFEEGGEDGRSKGVCVGLMQELLFFSHPIESQRIWEGTCFAMLLNKCVQ